MFGNDAQAGRATIFGVGLFVGRKVVFQIVSVYNYGKLKTRCYLFFSVSL